MSDEHDHSNHDHGQPPATPVPPVPPGPPAPEDAGSHALSEALRSSFFIVKAVMIILVAVFLCSGFFMVGPQQRAIILRLGKPVGEGNAALLGPGLHWAFPAPIDEVTNIPFSALQTVKSTVGWYYIPPEYEVQNLKPPPGPSLNPAIDGYVITADSNTIHVRATLRYRVEDPIRYAFDFTSASNAVQNALDNALLYAAAHFSVDDILTGQASRFQEAVRARVVELARRENMNLGIAVDQCNVSSAPPLALEDAFNGVAKALSTASTIHNAAQSEANLILGRATAEAANRTNQATTESVNLVMSVKAEADVFTALLPKYQANPTLIVNILLSQKIAQILPNVQDKVYLSERADGEKRQLWLQLSRETSKPATIPPPNQ